LCRHRRSGRLRADYYLYADSVDLGIEPPPDADTVSTWAFITNYNGWDFVPGAEKGSAGISGTKQPTGWTGITGVFGR
jgi:hypothetical protein